jgi:hypothetical protein
MQFVKDGESARVNGRDVTGPILIARKTSLGEISFVPRGADGNTSATVSAGPRMTLAALHRKRRTA